MPEMVYKVCSAEEWREASQGGRYLGSRDDRRDGFIHLSTAQQLSGTLARHFTSGDGAGLVGLLLIAYRVEQLGHSLKWEPGRDGSLFPHVYGPLETALAASVQPLTLGPDRRHILPGDLR